jgi:hypothetical protein
MSKESEQMEKMIIEEVYNNPCGFCYACGWSKVHDCYPGSYAQCSICSLMRMLMEKARAELEELKED